MLGVVKILRELFTSIQPTECVLNPEIMKECMEDVEGYLRKAREEFKKAPGSSVTS